MKYEQSWFNPQHIQNVSDIDFDISKQKGNSELGDDNKTKRKRGDLYHQP